MSRHGHGKRSHGRRENRQTAEDVYIEAQEGPCGPSIVARQVDASENPSASPADVSYDDAEGQLLPLELGPEDDLEDSELPYITQSQRSTRTTYAPQYPDYLNNPKKDADYITTDSHYSQPPVQPQIPDLTGDISEQDNLIAGTLYDEQPAYYSYTWGSADNEAPDQNGFAASRNYNDRYNQEYMSPPDPRSETHTWSATEYIGHNRRWIWVFSPRTGHKPNLRLVIALVPHLAMPETVISNKIAETLSLELANAHTSILPDGLPTKDPIEKTQSCEIGWAGIKDNGIIDCLVPVNSDLWDGIDMVLGANFLSVHQKALYHNKPNRPPEHVPISLPPSFGPVDPKKRRNFFKRGVVLRLAWPQPQAYHEPSKSGIFRVQGWSEAVHYKVTWFVIIQTYKAHCIALPIHTYGGQGAAKPGISSKDHAALVPRGHQQQLLPGEQLEKQPFSMIMETNKVELDQSSRINFAKPSTIEYNVKVMKIGRIVVEDQPRLQEYFVRSFNKDYDEEYYGQA